MAYGYFFYLTFDRYMYNTPKVNEHNDIFKYYFMALATSVHAWEYCFSIISVDGEFRGTILVASPLDGN